MPDSILGLWAALMVAAVSMMAAGYVAAFLWDYLYLSGGHW